MTAVKGVPPRGNLRVTLLIILIMLSTITASGLFAYLVRGRDVRDLRAENELLRDQLNEQQVELAYLHCVKDIEAELWGLMGSVFADLLRTPPGSPEREGVAQEAERIAVVADLLASVGVEDRCVNGNP